MVAALAVVIPLLGLQTYLNHRTHTSGADSSGANKNSADSQAVVTTREVVTEDLRNGAGPKVQTGSIITIRYRMRLTNGTILDDSIASATDATFQLDRGQVIEGLEKGVLGMSEGGLRTVRIPYQRAYGVHGVGTTIPPFADLVYEVELITVRNLQSSNANP